MGSSVITMIMQLIALFPTLIPAIRTVVEGAKEAFDKNGEITPADINNIVNRAVSNHATLVGLLNK